MFPPGRVGCADPDACRVAIQLECLVERNGAGHTPTVYLSEVDGVASGADRLGVHAGHAAIVHAAFDVDAVIADPKRIWSDLNRRSHELRVVHLNFAFRRVLGAVIRNDGDVSAVSCERNRLRERVLDRACPDWLRLNLVVQPRPVGRPSTNTDRADADLIRHPNRQPNCRARVYQTLVEYLDRRWVLVLNVEVDIVVTAMAARIECRDFEAVLAGTHLLVERSQPK